jgi:hypothetical protein
MGEMMGMGKKDGDLWIEKKNLTFICSLVGDIDSRNQTG